jgi:regulation of enolase protein 1 (concanavalin A-like superfamily)
MANNVRLWGRLSVTVLLAAGCDGGGREADTVVRVVASLAAADITSTLSFAQQQALKTENRLANSAHPRYTPADFQGGQWSTASNTDWRSGFFTGTEWLLYEAFGDNANGWRAKADGRTRDFSAEVSRPQDHDVGFKTLATYGLGFWLTNLEEFRPKVFAGANTLALRYLPQYGVTRSWNDSNGDVRVIVDNMMNLEVFFRAAELTSNAPDRDRWLNMAINHAKNTEQNQVRDSADPDIDGSTCHVYYYNLGVCRTAQGISNSSTWSRGQAWTMYGFTMSYQYARHYPQYAAEAALFLATAQRTSDLFLRRLAEPKHGDWVPLHDFDAAAGAPKDSSAAAIAASSLIELSRIPAVPANKRADYKLAAENILDTLRDTSVANPYRTVAAAGETSKESILLRATTSYTTVGAGIQQVERALVYADYYFVEALIRHQAIYGASPRAPGFLSGTRGAGGVALSWTGTRGAASYTVKRADGAAGPFSAVGTSERPRFTDTTALPSNAYHYVVTATNLAPAESAPSGAVLVPATLPVVWASQDVGAVAAGGSWSESSGTHTVRGSGVDIWANADEYRSVHATLSGNATIVARVIGLQNTDPFAKAGIMMRETLATGSKNVYAHVTPTASNGYRLQSRSATGGTTARTNVGSSATPVWLRLVRAGNTFTASYSTDGVGWAPISAAVSVTMAPAIYVGLAVTSHADGTLNTATFDNVTVTTP